MNRFQGKSAAVGTRLAIGGKDFTIIGVASSGFRGVDLEPVDAWIPFNAMTDSSGTQASNKKNPLDVQLALVATPPHASEFASVANALSLALRDVDVVRDKSARVELLPISRR